MGKFDYSLDLGSDLEKFGDAKEDKNTDKNAVETKNTHIIDTLVSKLNKVHFIMLFLLLIISFQYLTLTDKLYFFDTLAKTEVNSNLRNSISSRIIQNNPLISAGGLEKQILEETSQVKKTAAYKEAIKTRAEQIKDWHKDEEGQVYLYGIDPYYYYRMANQYVLWGKFENPNTNELSFIPVYTDPLRSSPRGESVAPTLLPYFTVYFYKIWSRFSNISVMTAAFYLPVLFGLLSVICFFFIAHKLFNNEIVTFCSTLLFALSQRFFIGNYAGNHDTQVLAFFFTLLFALIFVHFIDFSNKVKSAILFPLFYPVLVIFAKSWPPGWQYVLVLTFVFILVYFVLLTVKSIMNKKFNYYYLIGLVIPLFFISRLIGFIQRISRRLTLVATNQGWESKVGELKTSSIYSIADALGGVVLAILACVILIYLIYKNVKLPDKYEALTISWFVPLLTAGLISRRFTYFVAPWFCLLIGFGILYSYPYLMKVLNTFPLLIKQKHNKWLVCILVSVIIISLLTDDIIASTELFPEANDAIANTAQFINENSNESAIIITGMNQGYLWQALAMRGTIIDTANWGLAKEIDLYKALTNDKERFIDPIFLLATSGPINMNNLSESLNRTGPDILKEPRETFVVIDKDTFASLSEYYTRSRLDDSQQYANQKPLTVSELYDCFEMKDNKKLCGANFVVDLKNVTATQNGVHPNSLILVTNGTRQEKVFDNGVGDFALFVFNGENGYSSFFVDKKLKDTLTARLYSGEKIEGFNLVHTEYVPERVVTYKVNYY
ncbi:hypothetical protein HZA97_08515 [Candidatus Woesearchaeota archaeon]|nr:hypothetical protein [Candidatus Woesearchaeota archaeon]